MREGLKKRVHFLKTDRLIHATNSITNGRLVGMYANQDYSLRLAIILHVRDQNLRVFWFLPYMVTKKLIHC